MVLAPPPTVRPFYSPQEAAATLGISRSALYEHTRSGHLATLRVGRRVLIPRADLAAFRLRRKP